MKSTEALAALGALAHPTRLELFRRLIRAGRSGLGVGELSVGAGQVPSVKARVREVSLDACRALAVRALEASTATEVRTLLSETEGAP